MHQQQRDVEEFHFVMGIDIGDSPGLRRVELRGELIREEASETIDAMQQGRFVDAIDGLCDLIYVAYGAAIEWGIDLEPFWKEVQRANMAKAGGGKRADGKHLKPEGWKPPDIAGVLASQMPNGIENPRVWD